MEVRAPSETSRWGLAWKTFLHALTQAYRRDRIADVAGALTFFGVLAMFPFLLFVVALASVVIDVSAAERLVDELARVAPGDVARIVGERIRQLGERSSVGLLTLGGALAMWSAAGGMASLIRSLNTVHGVPESRPYWRVRLLAFEMTLIAALLSLVAAVAAVVAPVAVAALGGIAGEAVLLLRLPVAGLLMLVLLSLLYHRLPAVKQRFRLFTPGAVAGVALWLAASWGFSFYVSRFGRYEVTYGTLGGVIVLLLWMWLSAQALLIGAEINAVLRSPAPVPPAPVPSRMPSVPVALRRARFSWKALALLVIGSVVLLGLRRATRRP